MSFSITQYYFSILHLLEKGIKPLLVHTEKMPQCSITQDTYVTRSGRRARRSSAAQEATASQTLDKEITHSLSFDLDYESDIFAIFSVAEEKPEQLKMMHVCVFFVS
jgi:hypothetical protein